MDLTLRGKSYPITNLNEPFMHPGHVMGRMLEKDALRMRAEEQLEMLFRKYLVQHPDVYVHSA